MATIKGMTVLRSTPRNLTTGVATPLRDEVEIDLGPTYGRIVIPFFYVVRDDEVPHLVEWMRRTKVWGIDTETGGTGPMDGLDPLVGKVATVQIGNPTGADPRVYVLDVRCLSPEALAPVWALFADASYTKLGQNVRFEYKFLRTNFGVMSRNLADTQLTELVLRTGLFRGKGGGGGDDGDGRDRAAYKHTSMDALCKFYLGVQIDKDRQLRTSFYSTPPGQHSDRQRCYAGGDVVYPFYIAKEQAVELEARQLKSIAKLEHSIIPSLGEAELRGMAFDQDEWRVLWQESLTKLLEARAKLDALFLSVQGDLFDGTNLNVRPIYVKSRKSPPLNWGSSEQVKWAITRYCKAIGWTHEIITTYERLLEVKAVHGEAWRQKKAQHGAEVKLEDTPDWVVPEDQYCILLSAERDRLIIAACRKQLPWALVDPLADYSKYAKRVGTYGLKFIAKNIRKDTGAFHMEIHQCITTTGRISTVPNGANWPGGKEGKRYRKCQKARPGKKLCIADFSQVEPRITGYVSLDPVYCETYLTGGDLYMAGVERTLGYMPDKNTEEGAFQRQLGKVRVLSLAYNMGLMKYRDRLTLALVKEIRAGKVEPPTVEFAREQYDGFFEVHPGVEAWQEEMVALADPKKSTRKIWDGFLGALVTWIEAPCGRKRFFPPDANPYSEAPNVPPQAGSASMLKASIAMIQREIDARGWAERAYLINMIHDELVYEVDEAIAAEFAVLQKATMESAASFYNGHIPIIAEWPKHTNGAVEYWMKEGELEEHDEEHVALDQATEDAQDILDGVLPEAA